MLLSELRYSVADMQEDIERFSKTGIYKPSYSDRLIAFVSKDIRAFEKYINDKEFLCKSIFAILYQNGYEKKVPVPNKSLVYELIRENYKNPNISKLNKKNIYIETCDKLSKLPRHTFLIKEEADERVKIAILINGLYRNHFCTIFELLRNFSYAFQYKFNYDNDILGFIHSNLYAKAYLCIKALDVNYEFFLAMQEYMDKMFSTNQYEEEVFATEKLFDNIEKHMKAFYIDGEINFEKLFYYILGLMNKKNLQNNREMLNLEKEKNKTPREKLEEQFEEMLDSSEKKELTSDYQRRIILSEFLSNKEKQ